MASQISALLAQGKQAAGALQQAREHANDMDGTEEEMAEAWAQVDAAQANYDQINAELYRHAGQTVSEGGEVADGYEGQVAPPGASVVLTAEAEGRLRLGGAEETADMSPADVAAEVDRLNEQEIKHATDEIIEEQTGQPADHVSPETAARALREGLLEDFGFEDRPIIGVDPLDKSDEDRQDDLDEWAAKELAADLLGKDQEDLTKQDLLDLQEDMRAEGIARHTGIDAAHLTPVEQAQAAGEIRQDLVDQQIAAAKAEKAETDATRGRAPQTTEVQDVPDQGIEGAPGEGGTAGSDSVTDDVADTGNTTADTADSGQQAATDAAAETPQFSTGDAPPSDTGGGTTGPSTDVTGGQAPASGAEPVGVVLGVQGGVADADVNSDSYGEGVWADAYRAEDGRWFDGAGNEITDPTSLANLEALYDSYVADGGVPEEIGTITPTGETHEDAVAADDGGAGDGSAGSDSGASDSDSDSSSDDDGDDEDDEDDDGEDDDGEDEPTAEESDQAEEEEGEESEGEGGDEGTPTPDDIGAPTAEQTYEFLDTPVGASTKHFMEMAVRQGQGGGLIDVDDPGDRAAWYASDLSAQERGLVDEAVEMRQTGGHTDPPEHGEMAASVGSPVDELRLAGGGAIDPVDDAPGVAPADNPIVGPPPIDPRGGGSDGVSSLDDFDPEDDPDDPEGSGELGDTGDDAAGMGQTYLVADLNFQIDENLADNIDTDALDELAD